MRDPRSIRGGLSRRQWLLSQATGAGMLAFSMVRLRAALAAEAIAPGVARVRGDASINGRPAQQGMAMRPGDTLTTGAQGELVAVVGRDAFMARANSRIELASGASAAALGALRVVSGALLSVFAAGERREIRTMTAAIGIRGTAVYVEIQNARTYVCTCYGEAILTPLDDPSAAETVRTQHHDEPRYIYPRGVPRMIETAPVVNHTDSELILLESLVGRRVPFTPSAYPPAPAVPVR